MKIPHAEDFPVRYGRARRSSDCFHRGGLRQPAAERLRSAAVTDGFFLLRREGENRGVMAWAVGVAFLCGRLVQRVLFFLSDTVRRFV